MTDPSPKTLHGRHVLAMVVGFFGFLIVANVAFIHMAISTHRGEDVPKSYRQGLEYNAQIARRKELAELGWTIQLDYEATSSSIRVRDGNDTPVPGLEIVGTLRHPVDRERDIPLVFEDNGAGAYSARFPDVEGRWHLRAEALNAPMTVQSELRF